MFREIVQFRWAETAKNLKKLIRPQKKDLLLLQLDFHVRPCI